MDLNLAARAGRSTIALAVLLPAVTKLLGEWNWWLPRWLDWLPRLDLEPARDDRDRAPRRAPALEYE